MARLTLPKKLAFTAMIVTGGWLVAEAAVTRLYRAELRAWASPAPTARDGNSVLHGNPYLIYEYPPGKHRERGVLVSINSMGLRGPELTVPKPGGVRRFMSTGDSSVFGFGVQDDEVFTSVAAERLGDRVEAVCGATPGYSTYQTINLMRLRAMNTEPDLLVIGNIWSDNNFDSFIDKEVLATYLGYEESLRGSVKRTLAKSAIYRVMDWRLRVRSAAQKMQRVGWMVDSGEHLGLRRVEINEYARNLETLVDMADAAGAEVVFLMLANNEDLDSDGDNAGKAWDPYRQVMRDAASRHGAPLIDVVEIFRGSGLDKSSLFLDEMHPTSTGHALMGEALATVLDKADWANGGKVMQDGEGGGIPEYVDPFVKGSASTAGGGPAGGPKGDGQTSVNKIEGEVVLAAYSGGTIQIDAYIPGNSAPTVVSTVKLQGPGPFTMSGGAATEVALRAYLDLTGDGPDASDTHFDLGEAVIDLAEGSVTGVRIDLDRSTVEH